MAGISINELTTYRWTFEEDVRRYAAAGVQAITIWRHKLAEFGEMRGHELLVDHGLRVAGLMWAGGFTGSDGRSFQDAVADALEAISVAAELGADCLLVHSGARGGHTRNHSRRLLRTALDTLVPAAERTGVTLALESMHPQTAGQWTFITDLQQAFNWCREYDSGRLKIALDTYHFGHQVDLLETVADHVSEVAIVHLGDARMPPDEERDRCPLGSGVIPLKQWIDTLLDARYDGFFDIKLMGQEIEVLDNEQVVRESLATVSDWLRASV